jgi:hypothetical protein
MEGLFGVLRERRSIKLVYSHDAVDSTTSLGSAGECLDDGSVAIVHRHKLCRISH